jgi:hypothetical protein
MSTGKIKGLFCCLPRDSFYGFASFGLYAQQAGGDLDRIARTLFSESWFCSAPLSPLQDHAEVRKLSKVAGSACRLAKAARPARHLLFSRYSCLSSVRDFSKDDLEGGVFLALCRVLILNQMTVEGPITEAQIEEAERLHCDALYSSST